MRSILSRLAVAGVVGMLAATAVAPASAATRHKRAPAQTDLINQAVAARPNASNVPNIFDRNACVSDEGYGRYSYCDQGSL